MKKAILFFYLLLFTFQFSFAQGVWTWIKGDTTPGGTAVYGVQGISDSLNTPQGLYEPAEWTDLQGNFWLYGGVNISRWVYGDLWRFDVAKNNWTWIKGTKIANDTGNYGTQGVSSSTNLPPARGYGAPTWTDLKWKPLVIWRNR